MGVVYFTILVAVKGLKHTKSTYNEHVTFKVIKPLIKNLL